MPSRINGRSTYATDFIAGDWSQSVLLENPHIDNMMTTLVNLGAECWTTRRRLMVIETLLSSKYGLSANEIDSYEPTAEQQIAWSQSRDEFIRRVYASLTRDVTADTGPIDQTATTLRPPRTLEDIL